MAISLPKDQNRITAIGGTSSSDGSVIPVYVDSITHRLLVDANLSGSVIASHIQVDQFTATNAQTQFTASQTVISTLFVIVNGQFQTPGGAYDYDFSANVYTLTNPVPAGLQVILCYIF